MSAYFIMRKEVGGLVDEFCPQGDEKGVGQREPKKQTGAWQWKMRVGKVEDAVWKMIGGWRFGTPKRAAEAIRSVARGDARRKSGRCHVEDNL